MFNLYGTNRVIEPQHVLSTSAWKVDNNREILPNELRVSIKKLHIESTSFKQICIECNNNIEKIKDRIIDIVIKRGKLHNPVTDTGGLLYGTVEKIGPEYHNEKGLKVGDEVICNASLAAIPLYISRINRVDMTYNQIDAEGYAILFDKFPTVKRPEGVPVNLLLYAFDESGTLYTVGSCAKGKENFLVVGNNLLTNMLFGYAVRKAAGPSAHIVCLFDNKSEMKVKGKSIDTLLSEIFTEIHYVNILKPMECITRLNADAFFDLSINCADIPGAETINILATKSGGTVCFANLINNYNIALYLTESISRQLDIRCADGYLDRYDEFDIQIVKELAPYLEKAIVTESKVEDNIAYPLGRTKKGFELSGYRKSLVEDFICESRAMTMVVDEILSVAKYDCNVLITGDTGVGKEKVATIIQKNSNRRMQPFIKINCAAIADNLMESEFFGYEKGSFTGANQTGKKGYFEMADNGIIFLDEVGELPQDLQAKLLRVVQDGEFYRVGGTEPIKTNVRIISATNRNLEKLIEEKKFRRDLYYRLNVFPIRVPSLDERKAEIPALVEYFMKKYMEKFGMQRTIAEDALAYLKECSWPGNIRELENVVQRLLITAKGETITSLDVMKELHTDLFDKVRENVGDTAFEDGGMLTLDDMVGSFEKNIIQYACDKYGSTRKAAKAIGISQTQLIRKKGKYQIS
ncbi:sigma 54-interacting transcriptional regulator [Sinanaerobacter chloroacetimidivorans]|jgi:TyrR family helix-turn-helix protein|nr:sigma 54-interacting transcriptional regulator [Sinanaerobacter chloroacetimidivorans]